MPRVAVMKTSPNPYSLLGVALILGGAVFTAAAWLILEYRPLAALGVSSVILGAVALALGRSLPIISPSAGLMLLEAGSDNIAALIEELGLRAKGIYLPTSLTHGKPRALVPLRDNSHRPTISRPVDQRLIVQFGPGQEDFGVLVSTPGSPALSLTPVPEEGSSAGLEAALSAILVGALDVANSVRVSRDGSSVVVEVANAALPPGNHPVYAVLGSPLASIAATVVAEASGCPVTVRGETTNGRWRVIELNLGPEVAP